MTDEQPLGYNQLKRLLYEHAPNLDPGELWQLSLAIGDIILGEDMGSRWVLEPGFPICGQTVVIDEDRLTGLEIDEICRRASGDGMTVRMGDLAYQNLVTDGRLLPYVVAAHLALTKGVKTEDAYERTFGLPIKMLLDGLRLEGTPVDPKGVAEPESASTTS